MLAENVSVNMGSMNLHKYLVLILAGYSAGNHIGKHIPKYHQIGGKDCKFFLRQTFGKLAGNGGQIM